MPIATRNDPEASEEAPRPPRRYLDVSGYAQREFSKEYRHILAADFLDRETRSLVEFAVETEITQLQGNGRRYGYRDGDERSHRRAAEQRASDVAAAMGQMYSQLTAALSKHHVLILDLSKLPAGASGGQAVAGVYGGRF